MIKANPDYHCPITMKGAHPYYLFPKEIEEVRPWKKWFKMINTKMRGYQNKYHSIKSYYQSNC